MRTIILAVLSALILSATAAAGGFATVGVSPMPDGDDTWTPILTIKAHGRTPVDGVQPTITIRNGEGDSDVFAATPTGNPGEYTVKVAFPSPGVWTFEIWDAYSQTHTFAPVRIGTPAATPTPAGGFSWAWTLSGSAALALAVAALFLTARRPRPRPAAAS